MMFCGWILGGFLDLSGVIYTGDFLGIYRAGKDV